jgi:hypothetical protein
VCYLIAVALPPGKSPFTVQLNNNNDNKLDVQYRENSYESGRCSVEGIFEIIVRLWSDG